MRILLVLAAAGWLVGTAAAQQKGAVKLTDAKVTTTDHVYKVTPEGELTLHGFFPADWKATDK